MLNKVLDMQCQRDEEFAQIHGMMKMAISAQTQSDSSIDGIKEDAARSAYEERQKIITRISKNERFRDLFEETYLMIISDGGNQAEVEKEKLKAFYWSSIITCKASDIVLAGHGINQIQMHQLIQKYQLANKP